MRIIPGKKKSVFNQRKFFEQCLCSKASQRQNSFLFLKHQIDATVSPLGQTPQEGLSKKSREREKLTNQFNNALTGLFLNHKKPNWIVASPACQETFYHEDDKHFDLWDMLNSNFIKLSWIDALEKCKTNVRFTGLVVMKKHFTKYAEAVLCKAKCTEQAISRQILTNLLNP